MTEAVRRRAAAHVLVDDVEAPALDDDATHHVFRVLRVRDGETVTVTDGAGRWRACRAMGSAIEPTSEVERVERRSDLLTVAFAIPKQDRPEWIVQKLTEIGIDRIQPMQTERSIVRWPADRTAKHLVKLRRVAAEALQQSRGVWLPEILEPVDGAAVLGAFCAAEPGAREIRSGDVSVAIGPEGGWSDAELELAADRVAVGSTVLRVETAAIVVAARLIEHAA